jgi:cold shock CspA family protein
MRSQVGLLQSPNGQVRLKSQTVWDYHQPQPPSRGFFHFKTDLLKVQYSGTLKFFNSQRDNGGFGFICRHGADIDDFVHISAMRDAGVNPDRLENDVTRLAYDLVQDSKNQKMKATNVRLI